MPLGALAAPPAEEWLDGMPGVLYDDKDNVVSVAGAFYDGVFSEKTFQLVSCAQAPLMELAVQELSLLPKEQNRRFDDAFHAVKKANEHYGEQFFADVLINRGRTIITPQQLKAYRIARDSQVLRPQGRAKIVDSGFKGLNCSYCLRVSTDASNMLPDFTNAKISGQDTKKMFCKECVDRFMGKKPLLFPLTKLHFEKGKIANSLAAREIVRAGPHALTRAQMMANCFKTDKRDLIGYTYHAKYLSERKDRVWYGLLALAHPLRVFFCERTDGVARQKRSGTHLLCGIFRQTPERAVALWRLEHKLGVAWNSQNWYGLSGAGRMPVKGTSSKQLCLRADPVFYKLGSDMSWTPSQLLLWVDKGHATSPSPSSEYPFMMTRETVAMLKLIFDDQRVSITMVLDSNSHPVAPEHTQLMSLQLVEPTIKRGATSDAGKLTLTKCEYLSLDLLFFIVNRECVLGKYDMLDVELRGNFTNAVKLTNAPQNTFGFTLGHTFIDLVGYAMEERKNMNMEPMINIQTEPSYSPSNEPWGDDERCCELELGAMAANEWPPALPVTKKGVGVQFKDMIDVVLKHSRELSAVSPVCNPFAV